MAENRGKFLALDPYDENIITYVDSPSISITGTPYNVLLVNSTGNSVLTTPSLNYNPTTNILSSNELTISTNENIILSSNLIANTGNLFFSNCNQNLNEVSNIFNIYGTGCFQVGLDGNINLTTDDRHINFTAANGNIISICDNYEVISNNFITLNYGTDNNIVCKDGTGVGFKFNNIESYVLPTTKPSLNDVLICTDDLGSPSVLDWAPQSSGSTINWLHGMISWNAWSYFKPSTDVGVDYLVQSNQAWGNGSGSYETGTTPYDFGNVTITIPANGTYRFSFTFLSGTDSGIVEFTLNSVVSSFDLYAVSGLQSARSWDQVLTAGDYTINCNVPSKNPSSTKYFFLPMNTGLYFDRVL
jgi:hypothetical protein